MARPGLDSWWGNINFNSNYKLWYINERLNFRLKASNNLEVKELFKKWVNKNHPNDWLYVLRFVQYEINKKCTKAPKYNSFGLEKLVKLTVKQRNNSKTANNIYQIEDKHDYWYWKYSDQTDDEDNDEEFDNRDKMILNKHTFNNFYPVKNNLTEIDLSAKKLTQIDRDIQWPNRINWNWFECEKAHTNR